MPLLSVEGLSVVYEEAIVALTDVGITVEEGAMVAILGANGAGKSTLFKAISGVLAFDRGRVATGRVTFAGLDVTDMRAYRRARAGLLHVREGRFILPAMTVEENLRVADFALTGRRGGSQRARIEQVYDWFPVLGERRHGIAGFLSGGEQQMLAIGRALAGAPRLILVDEASLGLAPMIAARIFEILERINRETGLSILIVEQNVGLAMRHAQYVYVLENGTIALQGTPDAIGSREAISARYLGGARASA